MKKILFFAGVMLALVASGQLMNRPTTLPMSVQQFHLEQTLLDAATSRKGATEHQYLKPTFAHPRLVNGIEMVDAFIDISDSGVVPSLKAAGIKVNCEFDGFVTAQIPMAILDEVHMMPGVTNVEISRTVELCTDSTLSVTHAGQVLNGRQNGLPQAYDGTGVVVGIIDYGFDFQHRVFKQANDPTKTRIVRVYNTDDSTGHPVIIGGNTIAGSVFMGAQLDTMTTDDANGYHGTHTASIAAGSHINGYGGMAPGADIVLCASGSYKWGFIETEIVNCIKYIYSYADSVGKPCVISMSVSTTFGPHDGSDRVSKAISQLVGPGHIFVIAAGNTGNNNYYTSGTATSSSPVNMLLANSNNKSDNSYFYGHVQMDTWARQTNVRPICQFFIFDKIDKRIVWRSEYINLYKKINYDEISDYYEMDPSYDSYGFLEALISLNPTNMKFNLATYIHNLRCKVYTENNGYRSSRYQIGVSVYPPRVLNPRLTDVCNIDSWLCSGLRTRYLDVVYVDQVDENGDTTTTAVHDYFQWSTDYSTIGTYAVADSIISAGGYIARNSYYSLRQDTIINDPVTVGSFYKYTSFQREGVGPTGKALPTITAPAVNVVGAVSRYSSYACYGNTAVMYYGGSYWGVLTGTSMAAPTVAGIIAQWLQIKPDLSPGEVKNILAETAIKDEFTMDETNGFRFGPNGKIDALAGALSLTGGYIPGDVNGDGYLGIADLTKMIDYMLGEYTDDIVVPALDYNLDGIFDISDITAYIDYLIHREI